MGINPSHLTTSVFSSFFLYGMIISTEKFRSNVSFEWKLINWNKTLTLANRIQMTSCKLIILNFTYHAPIVRGEEITLGFCQRRQKLSKRRIVGEVTFCKCTFKDYLKHSQSIQETKNNTESEFRIIKIDLSIAIVLKIVSN